MYGLKLFSIEKIYVDHPNLKEDVEIIKQWLRKQPHLPQNITEHEIILHLLGKNSGIESSKKLIDNYYTFRNHVTEIFGSRDVLGDDIQMAEQVLAAFPLPQLTPEGYLVMFFKLIDTDPSKFCFKGMMKFIHIISECELLEHGPIKGIIALWDCEGFTIKHLLRMHLNVLHQCMFYMNEAAPGKFKKICLVNNVTFLDKFVTFVKPIMSKEMSEIFQTYHKVKDVNKLFPLELLPSDYEGGKAESVATLQKKYIKYLEDHREYFLNCVQDRLVKEDLRPEKNSSYNFMFGMEGNFKKLDID